jgi:hypothetical protein
LSERDSVLPDLLGRQDLRDMKLRRRGSYRHKGRERAESDSHIETSPQNIPIRDTEKVTPSLFDLPLRLGDAATLAELLLNQPAAAQLKPLTDDFRSRIAARASSAAFESMKVHFGSIERDPVHPSAFYVCVAGVENQPLLLRVATAQTPSSGLFPKAILIGRTFLGEIEAVLNVVPFGPLDHERILTFSDRVNPAFQPRSSGGRPVICVSSDAPSETFPLAFEAFRKILRSSGQNQAAFGLREDQAPVDFYFSTVWSAIRSGWREGYALHSSEPIPPIPGVRRRPFETELNVVREVRLPVGLSREQIAELL